MRPPRFILHIFRPPGSRRHKLGIIRLAASGKAHSLRCSSSPNRNRFAGLRFGRKRRLVTLWIPARPHSGAQAVTLSAHCYCGVRVLVRLADDQLLHLSTPTAFRRTDPAPVGSGGWCRAGCRCASDQSWWRRSALCTNELSLLQLTHILADGVGAHPHRSADSFVAGPALVGVSVLTADQIRVDGQRAG